MADNETTPEDEAAGGAAADLHREGLGERLQHAEHSVEQAIKDTLTAAEIRMIQAAEAETSGSPEVNFASAVEVALNPPHPEEATSAGDDDDEDAPGDKADGGAPR